MYLLVIGNIQGPVFETEEACHEYLSSFDICDYEWFYGSDLKIIPITKRVICDMPAMTPEDLDDG